MDNARWQITLAALKNIANDSKETPARRRIARNAILASTRGSGAQRAVDLSEAHTGINRGHSGGDSLHQDAVYDGWND